MIRVERKEPDGALNNACSHRWRQPTRDGEMGTGPGLCVSGSKGEGKIICISSYQGNRQVGLSEAALWATFIHREWKGTKEW